MRRRVAGKLEKENEGSGIGKENLHEVQMVHRRGVVRVICTNAKHRQRQG